MRAVYINGHFVRPKEASISIFDRGYLYGEGAFETLRAYAGRPAFCNLHYHRLAQNCVQLRIDLPLSEYAFERALMRSLQVNKVRNAYLRVTVSPVGASFGIARPVTMPTNVVIFCRDFHGRPRQHYARGTSVVLIRSVHGDLPEIATIKSTSYLTRMLARMEIQEAGADEGLLATPSGRLLEGSATNLFIVQGGRLVTPPLGDGVLPGVTRFVVMGCADSLGIPWREAHLATAHLKRADEIFLTGSTAEVLPVREVRGITAKSRTPGPFTRQLMAAYQKLLPH
ncbi:MAG: aminotransferase class IV [Deltaproteobacteria bacterium]|nr:aminotransferase class IV [Deltaproteobacteria bacterium]